MAPGISHNFPESCLQKLQGIIKHSRQAYTNFHLLLNREELSLGNGVAAGCCTNYSREQSCSSGSELGNIQTTLRVRGSSKLVLYSCLLGCSSTWNGLETAPCSSDLGAEAINFFSFGRHIFLKMDQSSSSYKTQCFKAIWKCLLSYSLYMKTDLA